MNSDVSRWEVETEGLSVSSTIHDNSASSLVHRSSQLQEKFPEFHLRRRHPRLRRSRARRGFSRGDRVASGATSLYVKTISGH